MEAKPKATALAALFATAFILNGIGQPIGQWDFESGNLVGTIGRNLEYADGAPGLTQGGTAFGTTAAFGLPNIGVEARVMRFPAATNETMGFTMPVNSGPSDNGEFLNSYTLIFDLLFTGESYSKRRALFEADNRTIDPDAEFFIDNNNGVGVSGNYSGQILSNTWHRIGLVVDYPNKQLRKYIDGNLVGTQPAAGVDDRFALNPNGTALLFADNDGETAEGYVNSIQLHAVPLTTPQMRAIGGPQASGIPREIPPIPSAIEKFIPAGEVSGRDTAVGAVIALGSTTIQDSSISVRLNGAAISSPAITRDAEFVTVRSDPQSLIPGNKYTNVVAYTDSLSGAKSFTNVFTSALFHEDFDDIPLGPNVDETAAHLIGDHVWTNAPPIGWTVDNTQMAGFGGPDDDGDGHPDGDGITEWWGWSFARRDWWALVNSLTDPQRRDEFTLASGNIAVSDPDEWDDAGHDLGLFNSLLITPEISLDSITPNSAFLRFVSSWRPEAGDDRGTFPVDENGNPTNNQTAVITVSFDDGSPVEVLRWDSKTNSPTFHTDMPNESVVIPLNNPSGAQRMKIKFGLLNAANDWWWAIDNVTVNGEAHPPVITGQTVALEATEGQTNSLTVAVSGESLKYQWFKGTGTGRTAIPGATGASLNLPIQIEDAGYYSVEIRNSIGVVTSGLAKVAVLPVTTGRLVLLDENFDGLALGPRVDEDVAGTNVWTKTGPADWTIDDTGVPGAGSDQDGVTEWAGWSFAKRTWWAETAGDEQRTQFLKGTNTLAIADSAAWDDIPHAAGNMDTTLKMKPISLQGVRANSVILTYDSSWRRGAAQKGSVLVSFDGGTPIELLGYRSDTNDQSFRPDELSEIITLRVPNPPNAQNMQVTFRYFDARDNGWWAIDNVLVLGNEAPFFYEDFDFLALGPSVDETVAATNVWTSTLPTDWTRDDDGTPGLSDPAVGTREWEGWNFARRSWWAQTAGDDPDRAGFLKGAGTIAVADGDQWDDKGHPAALGKMNTFLSTRPINITTVVTNLLVLKFDSSWRAETNQEASVKVTYDGGAPVELLRWESVEGGTNFHGDATNETVTLQLPNPVGATNMVITFGYMDAGDGGWWAIDSVTINAEPLPPPVITNQPVAVEVTEGQTNALAVAASGEGLKYQWFKGTGTGRTAIPGATGASLSLDSIQIEDAGYYSVEVTNLVGVVTSGLAKVAVLPVTTNRLVLLDENFDGLALGPRVDEDVAGTNVWTGTGPADWTIDDTGVPGAGSDQDGVTEWAGWSFAKHTWWAETAGDQQRTQFLKGTNTVAIADSAAWDDMPHAAGNMDTSLKTKPISLQSVKANSVILRYDSSWRPAGTQKGSVLVSFDGGTLIELLGYHSDTNDPSFRPDELSETIALRVPNPGNAQSMQLTFRYFDARDNWWWAIDNLLILGDKGPFFFEDFDSLVLGTNVDETLVGTNVWTSALPASWARDDDGTPGLNDPAVGVREWEGWNFTSLTWWAQTAGDSNRATFLKGVGTIAVADGDQWDDKGNPAALGKMNTFLSTRPISISAAPVNSLVLKFDSSWRAAPDQKANVRVAYDGATPVELLRWESVPGGANFHDNAPNETVTVPLRNPAGATNMIITFGYLDAGNSGWWAIDNIELNVVPPSVSADVEITGIQKSGADLVIGVHGRGILQLQKKTSLDDPSWTNVGAATISSGTFIVPADEGKGFFRVQKL